MPDDIPTDENNSDPPVQDTIRAKRFELIGADGKVAAVLGVIDKHPLDSEFVAGGNLGLALLDSDGRPQIRLTGRHPGHFVANDGLTIYSNDGAVCTTISSDGGVLVRSVAGGLAIIVGGSGPNIRIVEEEGFKTRMLLSANSIEIRASDGTQQFIAPS